MNDNTHTYKRYDKELDKLKFQVMGMGDLVNQQMLLMLDHLENNDLDDFEALIENDSNINNKEVKVGKTVMKLLAKRAPMGKDLRFIITASRLVTELERIGDEVVSMAKSFSNDDKMDICKNKSTSHDLKSLVSSATGLLNSALLTLQNEDAEKAKKIIDEHVKKGGYFHEMASGMKECLKLNGASIEQGFTAAMQVNALLRISDHICNICEHVIFLVSAKDIRHLDDKL